ncbi:TetR/AcrR family transcriptional regulator [Glycomyces sp. TRM65418]|uniref:TetR/AcrR family transcriptional regulator n=1 Tax=Glycomyces sp. TRM65418 TaxID=2867006 RepID=UPI001CE6004F|nr:TetR/AcrR family transcriptional regulator [Glycomyces sp. TRM65418]MCC3762813.1 TetR/AcrR family transcriptional regulator [Glycomyces sp. TRM65418]QZD56841.1 TetR/AcrR family transcriptional regulator [Glycomyces sp. TRM65418]
MPPELSEALTAHDDAAASAPAKGRPRSEAVSQSILEAALDLIAEHGNIGDVSVEGIAERSGVSKASIYRRWSSKEELIAAAIDSVKAPLPTTMPRISLRDDLVYIGNAMRRNLGPRDQKVVKCVMLEIKEPDFQRQHDRLVKQRRQFVKDTFAYWVEHGEMDPGLDLDLAVAMFVSPLLTIFVYGHYAEIRADDTVERLVDSLIRGLGTALAE